MDDFGQPNKLWTQVSNTSGNNAIYNSLANNVRDIYNVVTKADDKIDLVFGDGNFANIPLGRFRAYYRTSDNEKFSVQPFDLKNIQLNINYTDANGGNQTLTASVSLEQSIYLSLIHI